MAGSVREGVGEGEGREREKMEVGTSMAMGKVTNYSEPYHLESIRFY